MHLYDVDADLGRDQNETVIAEIARDGTIDVLVSGGPASEDRIDRLIDLGVNQVILAPDNGGDVDGLARLADSFPGRLIIRADLGDPLFSRRSGRRNSASEMIDFALELSVLPIGGLAVHGLSSDGFSATPLRFVEELVDASSVPVFYRIEATTVGELRALEHLGIAATLLGTSLFDGQLDAQAVAHHFEA